MYGDLVQGKRGLWDDLSFVFKNVAKREMLAIGLPTDSWETLASVEDKMHRNLTTRRKATKRLGGR